MKANIKVRVAVAKAGIRYTDLAETMKITPQALSSFLKTERSEEMQREIVKAVKETQARLAE